MLRRNILLFSLLIMTDVSAQQGYLPYGVMRVNKSLVADQTEILVGEWLGYVVSVCDSDRLRVQLPLRKMSDADKNDLQSFRYPDSLLPERAILETLDWRFLLDTSSGYHLFKCHGANWPQVVPLSNLYLTTKEKRKQLGHLLSLPITGISYAQAMAFCKWRTKVDSMRSDTLGAWPHYKFRLPTIAEFTRMNQQLDSTISKKRRGGILRGYEVWPVGFNYRNVSSEYLDNFSRSNALQSGWEYGPDDFGFYAVQGNAAEMTSREGAACGGSYHHFAIESYRYQIQVYEHPERWLGFRCVATIQ